MSQGPKSFAMIGKELDEATFDDALKKDYECELHWFKVAQKTGSWKPTLQIIREHILLDVDNYYRICGYIRSMWWCIGVEALAILALIALHLHR